MNTASDRRRKPRIPMCWPVVLMTPQGPIKGISEDISMDGILVLCSEPIETDDEFEIAARLPKEYEMSITAKKIWSNGLLADDSIYYETGFCFTKISQGDHEIIASMVEEYNLI